MLINMSPCGPTLEEQLSSIIDVLAKSAVSEISQLFSEGSATLRSQITQSLKENQALSEDEGDEEYAVFFADSNEIKCILCGKSFYPGSSQHLQTTD